MYTKTECRTPQLASTYFDRFSLLLRFFVEYTLSNCEEFKFNDKTSKVLKGTLSESFGNRIKWLIKSEFHNDNGPNSIRMFCICYFVCFCCGV